MKRAVSSNGYVNFLKFSSEFVCRKYLSEKLILYLNKKGRFPVITNRVFNNNTFTEVTEFEGSTESNIKVIQLNGGFIFSSNGMVITNKGVPVADSVLGAAPNPLEISSQSQVQAVAESLNYQAFNDDPRPVTALIANKLSYLNRTSKNIKTATPLASRFPNYYHWMINTVPRIRYLEEYQNMFQKDIKFIVPLNPPPWVTETISLLGIEPSVEWASSPIYRADNAIVTTAPSPRLEDYNWIKSRILKNKSRFEDGQKPNNIYISRSSAIERRVVNEEEVVGMLKKYGFKRYLLENNSLSENAMLFSNANMVVGPHGAGLTDIIFCDGDATVVELSGKKYNTAYKNISEKKDLNYIHHKCEPRTTDLYVDVKRLERIIKEAQRRYE